ncbi:hypothetical protein FOZ62_011382, partial [Perkinsus olseni]
DDDSKEILEKVKARLGTAKIRNNWTMKFGIGLAFMDKTEMERFAQQTSDDIAVRELKGRMKDCRLICKPGMASNDQDILDSLRLRNGIDPVDVRVLKIARSGSIYLRGPEKVIAGILSKGLIFVGLGSAKVVEHQFKRLCNQCGKHHSASSPCQGEICCIKCGGKGHTVQRCDRPRDWEGRSCTVCGLSGHSAQEFMKCRSLASQAARNVVTNPAPAAESAPTAMETDSRDMVPAIEAVTPGVGGGVQ